mgnify:CR=1 FL=1
MAPISLSALAYPAENPPQGFAQIDLVNPTRSCVIDL